MTGQKFNRLTAIRFIELDNDRGAKWLFQCDCGKEYITSRHNVVLGLTKSCGCLNNEMRKKPKSLEQRLRMKTYLPRGEKCHLWRGGITIINKAIRSSFEYRLWRESVFKRDNYTCKFCGQRGNRLHADHIKPFAYFPELRFDLNNGRTLCKECHKTTDTYGFRVYHKFNLGLTA